MIILDEQIPAAQRLRLRQWRLSVRHIGHDIGRSGMKDDEIIPLLLRLRRPTFFSLDYDFFGSDLCHKKYCLVRLDVGAAEAATFVRRVLNHPSFDTEVKRLGSVLRATHAGIVVWRVNAESEAFERWP